MSSIQPLEMSMYFSRNIIESRSNNAFIATVQKIAICTIVPFLLIVFAEALIKNLLFINAANLGIAGYNFLHGLLRKTGGEEAGIPAAAPLPAPLTQEAQRV